MWLLKFFSTSHVRPHSRQCSTIFVTNWQLWHGHAYTTESNFHMDLNFCYFDISGQLPYLLAFSLVQVC